MNTTDNGAELGGAGTLFRRVTREAARSFPHWGIYIPVLLALLLSAQLRVEGDTLALITGTRNALQCIAEGVIPCNRYVVHFPIFQYVVALPWVAAGLDPNAIGRILAGVNVAAALATCGLFYLVGRRVSGHNGGHLALALVLSGYGLYYSFSSFNEVTAFFLFAAFCAAVLFRRPWWLVLGLAFLCCATKETAPPFVLLTYAVARVAGGDGKRDWRSLWADTLQGHLPVVAGMALGIGVNMAFNWFRFGSVVNTINLAPLLRAPPDAMTAYFAYLFISPAGGLLFVWLSLMALAAVLVVVYRKDDFGLVVVSAAIGILIATNLGLSFWWSPLGWNAWGPRLTFPTLGIVAILLIYKSECLIAIMATGKRRLLWAALLFALLAASMLPNILVVKEPGEYFSRLFAQTTMNKVTGEQVIYIQKDGPAIYKLVSLEAYGRPVIVPTTITVAGRNVLIVLLSLAYVALASWRISSPHRE